MGNTEVVKLRFTVITVEREKEDDSDRYSAKVDIDEVIKAGSKPIPYTCFVKGYFLNINEGDTFEAEGSFKGKTFHIQGLPTLIIPSSIGSIIELGVSQIKGVSTKTFKPVVEHFGVDVINILANHPERIKEIKLTRNRRDAILTWCKEHVAFDEVLIEFLSYGLGPKDTVKLYKKFNDYDAIYQVQKNPYSLVLYDFISFKKIDRIVAERKIKDINSEDRLKAGIWSALKKNESDGNMSIVSSVITKNVNKYMNQNSGFKSEYAFTEVEILIVMEDLISSGYIVKFPFKVGEKELNAYYRKSNYAIEMDSAKMSAQRILNKPKLKVEKETINKYLSKNYPTLSDKQIEAVHMAVNNSISILTGGPGCGKTFTLNAIIHFLESKNIKTKLMAPTGKAAVRMMELTNRSAVTIHSALKITPETSYDEIVHNYIDDVDWIIIDEVSMMDAFLWHQVLKHTAQHVNILLCGDVNQLPSVGAGDVLNQLINNPNIPSVMLDKIFRQKGEESMIVENAYKIKSGDINIVKTIDLKNKYKDFEFIETNSENAQEVIAQIVDRLVNINHINIEDIMVLTPMHKAICGTYDLNIDLQKILNKGLKIETPIYKYDHFNIYLNDRILITKNQVIGSDNKRVYNGETGFVQDAYIAEVEGNNGRCKKTEVMEILIDGQDDMIIYDDLESLLLSYAITIHKSQGSEALYVIMPFLPEHSAMLTNKLIYTAITRAKGKFIGVGDPLSFYKGCIKKDERHVSLLSYMIRQELSKK